MKKQEKIKIINKINRYCEKHGMRENLKLLIKYKYLTYAQIKELTKCLVKMRKDRQFVKVVLDRRGNYCYSKIVPMSKWLKCKSYFTFKKGK